MSQTYQKWINDYFDDKTIPFPDQTKWKIGKKLSEKCFHFNKGFSDISYSESSAVYHCRQVEGPEIGKEAIMKLWLQVPVGDSPDPDPDERAKDAISMPPDLTLTEVKALDHLTESGCTVVPKVITWCNDWQLRGEAVPGGYIFFLVMEKLPGVSLADFSGYSSEELARIRHALLESLAELESFGIEHLDERSNNLYWDSKTGKCYILDFEIVHFCEPVPKDQNDLGHMELVHWGMTYYKDGKNVYY